MTAGGGVTSDGTEPGPTRRSIPVTAFGASAGVHFLAALAVQQSTMPDAYVLAGAPHAHIDVLHALSPGAHSAQMAQLLISDVVRSVVYHTDDDELCPIELGQVEQLMADNSLHVVVRLNAAIPRHRGPLLAIPATRRTGQCR